MPSAFVADRPTLEISPTPTAPPRVLLELRDGSPPTLPDVRVVPASTRTRHSCLLRPDRRDRAPAARPGHVLAAIIRGRLGCRARRELREARRASSAPVDGREVDDRELARGTGAPASRGRPRSDSRIPALAAPVALQMRATSVGRRGTTAGLDRRGALPPRRGFSASMVGTTAARHRREGGRHAARHDACAPTGTRQSVRRRRRARAPRRPRAARCAPAKTSRHLVAAALVGPTTSSGGPPVGPATGNDSRSPCSARAHPSTIRARRAEPQRAHYVLLAQHVEPQRRAPIQRRCRSEVFRAIGGL